MKYTKGRRTFAVGKVTPKTSEIVMIQGRRAPFPGPWTLKAITRPVNTRRGAISRAGDGGLRLVH